MKLDYMHKLNVVDSYNLILREQLEIYIKNYKLLCFDNRHITSMGCHDTFAIAALRELGELHEAINSKGIDVVYADITMKGTDDDESYYDIQLRRLNDLKKEIEVIKKKYEKGIRERDEI